MSDCNLKPDTATRRKVTIFDLHDQFINKLRFHIGIFDWDSVLWLGNANHADCDIDIDAAYARFLIAIHSLVDCWIPTRIVTVGPRDPEFVTPFGQKVSFA